MVIIGCEAAFWVALLLGLFIRYVLRARRAGGAVLACVPLIDLVLLLDTIVNLRSGATPDITAGLAAVYIGVSVAFGPGIIRRMDARFAHRFAHAPPPPPRPRHGHERVRYEWQEFRKALLAWAVSCVPLLAGVPLAGGFTRAAPLLAWMARVTLVLLIWLIWPVSYSIWPGRPPPGRQEDTKA